MRASYKQDIHKLALAYLQNVFHSSSRGNEEAKDHGGGAGIVNTWTFFNF